MVIATTAATAGISSAKTDGGIINTLLKVAIIVFILGLLIIGYMWASDALSITDVFNDLKTAWVDSMRHYYMKYTPAGWLISAATGIGSFFFGKAKGLKFW
jgi:TRAP-type C4-dicarboxylate transport system permease small subunit